MTNQESRLFIKCLGIAALAWGVLGGVLNYSNPESLFAFLQIFFYVCLDLVFLILLFWKVFFSLPGQPGRQFQILFFLTFKLVCLGFLAITLKRLNKAPMAGILTGIVFIWIGPLVAGLVSRFLSRRQQGNP